MVSDPRAEASSKPLVAHPDDICLGIAGRVDEDDHPFSWSAILNRYDPDAMLRHADPAIAAYLGKRASNEFGIAGVRVTHVWAERADDARKIAEASRIPTVVADARDLIGTVDAVLIPTDIGGEHVARARPFVEAGVPVFIDKPLVTNASDLATFREWIDAGCVIASSSGARYSPPFTALREELPAIGTLRLVTATTAKSWDRYAIHALEGVYPLLPAGGWIDVANTGSVGAEVAHYRHASNASVIVAAIHDMTGAFGVVTACGTSGHRVAQYGDSFSAFKAQLAGFVSYLRTGVPAVPFAETEELMRLLIAGRLSRECGGARIDVRTLEATGPDHCPLS